MEGLHYCYKGKQYGERCDGEGVREILEPKELYREKLNSKDIYLRGRVTKIEEGREGERERMKRKERESQSI